MLLTDWVQLNQAYMLMNGLVEINEKMEVVPELLKNREPKPGASEWVTDLTQPPTLIIYTDEKI